MNLLAVSVGPKRPRRTRRTPQVPHRDRRRCSNLVVAGSVGSKEFGDAGRDQRDMEKVFIERKRGLISQFMEIEVGYKTRDRVVIPKTPRNKFPTDRKPIIDYILRWSMKHENPMKTPRQCKCKTQHIEEQLSKAYSTIGGLTTTKESRQPTALFITVAAHPLRQSKSFSLKPLRLIRGLKCVLHTVHKGLEESLLFLIFVQSSSGIYSCSACGPGWSDSLGRRKW